MIQAGQIIFFRFPQTDHEEGKLRPALVLRRLPGRYDDYLICMISSQLFQEIPGFDEIIGEDDTDFKQSGLRIPSVIRVSRIAVVNKEILLGIAGHIDSKRLKRIITNLVSWINEDSH